MKVRNINSMSFGTAVAWDLSLLTMNSPRLIYALIIDTDESIIQQLSDLFAQEGIEFVIKDDSTEALESVMEREPDFVIMADDMPPVETVDLLPALRQLTHAPIFVVGEGLDMAVVVSLLQGADAYMMKPLNYRELMSRMRAALRRRGPPKRD